MATEQTQQQQTDNGAGGGKPWYGDLPADTAPEFKEWIGTKGFKDPLSALQSAHNAEKLIGAPADQILRLPSKPEDAEGWGKVHARLGRPEKAEGYELPLPEGDDGSFAKLAAEQFFKAGVPKAAAQGIAKWWNEHIAATVAAQQKDQETKATQALEALKTEVGTEAWPQFEEFGRRGLRAYGEKAGLTTEDLGALERTLGTAKLLKLFSALGQSTGESEFNGDQGGGGFTMSPSQAKVKLEEYRTQRIEGKITEREWIAYSEQLAPLAQKALGA